MEIQIIGTESYGVRAMCCKVKTARGSFLIDPGVSLAPSRYQLPPHPIEIEAAKKVSKKIESAAGDVDTIVISHFHHDHFTPFYQHEYNMTSRDIYKGKRILIKSPRENINMNQKNRAQTFLNNFPANEQPAFADGKGFGSLYFSPAVPHGEENGGIFVIMTAIRDEKELFIHASDIQSVHKASINWIISQNPQTVFVSGPPIYLPKFAPELRDQALENIWCMVENIPILILDHHLARTTEYNSYLADIKELAKSNGHKIMLGSEYMGEKPELLEAGRKELYGSQIPINKAKPSKDEK